MAHYAFLNENNIVTEVIVGVDESELVEGMTPEEWYGTYRDRHCVRTSYNGKIRGRFAGIGYTYNEDLDAFIRPKPFDSWHLDINTTEWVPPNPKPDGLWEWNESLQNWVEIEFRDASPTTE